MEMKHIYKEMKHLSVMFLVLLQLFTFTSCVEEEEYANTPTGNFEALWRIMDEHYCFFDLKQKELGVDWDNVHARYSSDGQRGGTVKVRAKIEKLDNKTLVIRDIPFSRTSESLIDSITRAVEKGKVKVRKVEDLTAANVEILVHLTPGVSSDKTLDALYIFTDCEVSISPNCCVIKDRKPQFLTISDLLRASTDQTLNLLLRQED